MSRSWRRLGRHPATRCSSACSSWGTSACGSWAKASAIAQHGADPFQPFGTALSRLWAGWGDGALVVGRHAAWWLAVGLILAFIPYFPYTKHFHLIMSGVNFLTKPKRTSPGALDPIDFADESREEFGAARIEQLPWPRLMDAYACIMCNRCQDVCPATVTGKSFRPRRWDQQALLPERTWTNWLRARRRSMTCWRTPSANRRCGRAQPAACVDICPVGNEPMLDVMDMRRRQVLMENRFPSQLKQASAAWSATAIRGT